MTLTLPSVPTADPAQLRTLTLAPLPILTPGKVEHGGHPISKGLRYIIVLFMGYEANRMTRREDGYVLRALERAAAGKSAKDLANDPANDVEVLEEPPGAQPVPAAPLKEEL